MASHIVKCLYCKQQFDAKPEEMDIVWFKPRTNRYAHIACKEKKEAELTQEEKDFDELYRYVKKEQGQNFNFIQFKKIVEAWVRDYQYSYSGILKSLLYFYEVKGNSKDKLKEGSLGIVPFCYTQAYNYYYNIYLANQVAGTGNYNSNKQRIIEIDAPKQKELPPKLFNMED